MSVSPPVPPGPRVRRRPSARLVAGLVLLLVGAAAVAAGRATWRSVGMALAVQDQRLARVETRFEAVPLLTDGEAAALRRSLNRRHVALARELGVAPPPTRAARDSLAASLVDVADHPAFVVTRATYSVAALTPDAAAALDSVGAAFQRGTARAGVPAARATVTSVFRSGEDQAGLRTVNANAAAGTSSHEYATTFDLAYRRYEAFDAPLPPVTWSRWTPGPLRASAEAALDARWQAAVAAVAAAYPARYDALLGRALVGLEDRGVLVVVRERQQPVYHVTVARRLAAP